MINLTMKLTKFSFLSHFTIHNLFIITTTIILPCFSPVFAEPLGKLTPKDELHLNQTLISPGGKFELGFFTKGNPTKYYLGIWYKDIPSNDIKIWVANRNKPSYTNSTSLKLSSNAQIMIFDGGSDPIWSTNQSKEAINPVLLLLDSGNLVVSETGDQNPNVYIWQSFDYPTDTLIPGQKLGWFHNKSINRFINSWRNSDDPGTGDYSFKLDFHGDPEIYLWERNQIIYRSGPWVGQRFSGVPEMKSGNSNFNFSFHINDEEIYYTFTLPPDDKVKSRLMVTVDGYLKRWTWVPDRKQWIVFWYARKDQCDYYKACGPYVICNVSSLFICQCPYGFEPRDGAAWGLRDGSSGCVRKSKLDCESDGFLKLVNMKLPETTTSFVDKSMDLDQCRDMCKKNCSCTAFANAQVVQRVGSGCVIWTDSLMDMRDYAEGGQDLYIRLASSDLAAITGPENDDSDNTKKVAISVVLSLVAAVILIGLVIFFLYKRKKSRNLSRASRTETSERSREILMSGQILSSKRDYSEEAKKANDFELPFFDSYTLSVATNNFSDDNKLGQGGFGRVYKGVLLNGQEIAVKRLSKESGQGVEEFKNEVKLIAKLQHRNLVRLLGYCVEMDEKMLIYEYLKNRSLDSILFHKERSSILTWQKRFNIICGIARGLLYLHQDSRYRIIHRDLKASNVLLDADLEPKISDFGMARIFGGDETEGNTRRVVGTYGYMAPEYAMDGLFSTKSDVFSFGVLVLEIISGKKNRGFYNSNNELNLLGYAFKQWKEGKGTELLDQSIGEVYLIRQVLGCIQMGLLCVQERAEERPTMASVMLMLSSETPCLSQPKLPGFCMGWNPNETDSSSSKQDESFTINRVTVSMLNAR